MLTDNRRDLATQSVNIPAVQALGLEPANVLRLDPDAPLAIARIVMLNDQILGKLREGA